MSTQPGYATRMVQGAPSIVELARALKNDVDLIYSFVHDHIEFLPTYGSQKGALGCLIDQMGNSFDQSELMIELLREAGYTASYQLGELEITQADAAAWLGTETTDIWAARNLLNEGFIPNEVYWTGSEYKLRLTHCFVKVTISGTDYVFDPAKKTYTTITGMSLATAMSYSQSTFMSNATSGATVTSDYVQDINRSNIRDDLDTFTDNLLSYINTNNPDASVEEVLGGKVIDPVTSQVRNTALPYLRPSTTPTTWSTDIPSSYCATLRVLYDSPNIDETFYSKDIHCKRLTITFNGSHQAELRLDGALQATSSAQTPGSWNSVLLEPKHPYATTGADQSFWMTIWEGHPFLIAQAWGNAAGSKMLELHQEKLKQNRFDGGADSDEDVIGEAFSVIWHSWNAQNNRASDICNTLSQCRTMYHHQVGLFGHFDTVYEDLPGILWKTAAVDNDWDNVEINDNAMAMHGIAFEAAVMEQIAGVGGASATTIIDIANNAGDKIYDGSSSNWSSNVKPNLTNYNSGDLTNVENWWINAGWRVAIPEDGAVAKDDWTGFAYYAISPYQGTIGIIGGSLKGGSGAEAVTVGDFEDTAETGNKDFTSEILENHSVAGGVDLVSGQYTGGAADLNVGSASYPYGLKFARSYRSSHRLDNAGLGQGWSHNHQMTVSEFSDGMLALATNGPFQGAVGIVELFVAVSLFGDLTKPMDKWVTAAIANQWLTDNATHNAIVVNVGGEKRVFVKSADGSFIPPLAGKSNLQVSSGLYTLTSDQGVEFNFNSSGDIATIDFPAGPTITYTYTSGKLSSVSNGMGRTLTFTYTSDLLTSVSDGNGRSIGLSYDVDNNLETLTDAEGEDTDYEYSDPGILIKVFRPANPISPIETNTYDTLNRIKERKDAYNNVSKFYVAGPRTEVEDATGEIVVSYNNHQGLTTEVVDQLGFSTTSEFDGLGRLTKTTAPEGNSTEYEYDSSHNVKKVTAKAKPGSGLSDIVNEFTYDTIWNYKVKTAKDGLNNTTTYTYNSTTGTLTKIEFPQVGSPSTTPEVSFTYNGRGQVLTKTDPTGIVTEFTYDSVTEKLTKVVVDKGTGTKNLTTEFTYDSVGNVTAIDDPNGESSSFEYDDLRRLTKTTEPSPLSYQTKYTYDANSNRIKVERETGDVSNPWQISTASYAIDDLFLTVTDPGSQTTSFDYTNLRQLWKTTDAASRVIARSYDEVGRLETVTDNANVVQVTNTYTDNGLLEIVEDGEGNETEYQFDGFDRHKKTIFSNSKYEELTYDACNRVTNFRTRNADNIGFSYDDLGRLTQRTATGMPTVSLEYDLAGRKTKISTAVVSGNPASGDFEYYYDSAGRLTKEEWPDNKSVQYEYDDNGNVTKMTYPDSYFIERVFDEINRLTGIKLNGSTSLALEFEYDKLSRRTKLTCGNGVETDYGFELDDDLDSLIQTFVGSSVEFTYGFNNVHELTSQQVDDSAYLWHPPSAGTVSYGSANNMNQYPSVGGNSFSYDDNGCLIDDGVFDYTYDAMNQLIEADDGSTVSTYIYDPMRRQNQKNVGGTKTRYVYDGLQMIAEYDGSGILQKKFVYGASLNEVLIELDSSNNPTYLHHDRMGSVIARTNGSGAVVNTYAYSPFGEGSSLSGATFGYTGQRYDQETGLYYYKNRHYSPALGRFLQPDPKGYEESLNLYPYVLNTPLNATDPDGRGYIANGPLIVYMVVPIQFPMLYGISIGSPVIPVFNTDWLNIEVAHQHIFFTDGKLPSDIGYGPGGLFSGDGELENPHKFKSSNFEYLLEQKGRYIPVIGPLDDAILRKAVDQTPVPAIFLGIGCNCQTYASRVLEKYDQLKAEADSGKFPPAVLPGGGGGGGGGAAGTTGGNGGGTTGTGGTSTSTSTSVGWNPEGLATVWSDIKSVTGKILLPEGLKAKQLKLEDANGAFGTKRSPLT